MTDKKKDKALTSIERALMKSMTSIPEWALAHRHIRFDPASYHKGGLVDFIPTKEEMQADDAAIPFSELPDSKQAETLRDFQKVTFTKMSEAFDIGLEELTATDKYKATHPLVRKAQEKMLRAHEREMARVLFGWAEEALDTTPAAIWKRNRAAGMKDVSVNEMTFEGKTFTRNYYTGPDNLRVLAVECDGVIVERTTIL